MAPSQQKNSLIQIEKELAKQYDEDNHELQSVMRPSDYRRLRNDFVDGELALMIVESEGVRE